MITLLLIHALVFSLQHILSLICLHSRFLVRDPNNVLCLRPYRSANVPQLSHCFSCLTRRQMTISHQPPPLLFTNCSQSQSQSYFATGGLPPVSSSWRQAPWEPWPVFLFSNEHFLLSRSVLGSTQPPIQWVPGTLSPGVKRQGREADHSPPGSAEVKKVWIYTFTPTYAFMA
jgi:hypothetical protein